MHPLETKLFSPLGIISQSNFEPGYLTGSPFLVEILNKYIPNICLETAEGPKDLLFVRDHAVVCLDGSWLVPYSFKSDELGIQFKALQPLSLNGAGFVNLLSSDGYGTGFELVNYERTFERAKIMSAPIRSSICAIEGGNCYLFNNAQGQPTALIGLNSLLLTLLAMDEQGLFKKLEVDPSKSPTEHALQMAKNWRLYESICPFSQQLKKIKAEEQLLMQNYSCNAIRIKELCLEKGRLHSELQSRELTLSHLKSKFQTPVNSMEKEGLLHEARLFDQKIALAKKAISDDLKLPEERIAYLEQSRFHLDMELFIGQNTVFMHSEELSLKVMGKNRSMKGFADAAQKRLPANKAAIQANCQEIKRLGLSCVHLPGIYQCHQKNTINFMNGIFVRPDLFLTNDPINGGWAKEAFLETANNYHFDVEFVGKGILESILTHNNSGLHCLTREFY
ncbi:MAG: hypothetical protein LW832_00270 [Parachlamydia sp.]|jgi:hypothetical protein|nr:hypothetical protein [Parachlamydia sp.]